MDGINNQRCTMNYNQVIFQVIFVMGFIIYVGGEKTVDEVDTMVKWKDQKWIGREASCRSVLEVSMI